MCISTDCKYSSSAARTRSSAARGLVDDSQTSLSYSIGDEEPVCTVDSSWQVHNKATRSRSTTGIIFSWKNGPISVKSNGQKWQAITSTDAESHGIASAMYEGIVIRGHCKFRSLAPPNWRMTILGAYSSPATPRRCITPVLLPCARSSAKNASSSACSIPLTCRPAR